MYKTEDNSIIIFLIFMQLMMITLMIGASIGTLDKKDEASNEIIQGLEDKNNKIETEKKEEK